MQRDQLCSEAQFESMTSHSIRLSHEPASNLARARLVRGSLAAVCLAAIGFLWRILGTSPAQGKLFGLYSNQSFILLLAASYALAWGVYFALSREPRMGKLANCGLTSASLLILFAMLELPAAFGWIDYRKIISPPADFRVTRIKPWDNPGNLLDKELMHIHQPHQRIVGEASGDLATWLGISTDRRYQIDLQYDNHGFRNDHDIEQAGVVVIGDSFVEGILVPQANLVSSRLSQLLQVEVANLGQGGYGPQQELATLRRYGMRLRPKLVLWFFFEGNDLLDVPRYEHFVRNWESIARERNSWSRRSFVGSALLTLAGFSSPKSQHGDIEAHRRSCEFLRASGGTAETLYFAYPGQPLSEEELTSLGIAQDSILEADKVAADGGAEFILVYIPTKFRVYCDSCKFPDDGYGKDWHPNDLPSRLETWCKLHEIHFLDLTSNLKESGSRGELVYFTDDGHWSPKGHEVVSETVSEFIKKNGFLQTLR